MDPMTSHLDQTFGSFPEPVLLLDGDQVIYANEPGQALLQEEAELEEVVKMVGMDALSPGDRLKLEAARSIREDFLHQNSFHEIDTYTSLKKQYRMMKLVLGFYEQCTEALEQGAPIQGLLSMEVREQIGRYKYTPEEDLDVQYEAVKKKLASEIAGQIGKEER